MTSPTVAAQTTTRCHLGERTIAQLARVLPAAGRDRQRLPSLRGVLLDGHRVAATDDRRLAVADVPDVLPRLLVATRTLDRAVAGVHGGPAELTVAGDDISLRAAATGRAWRLAGLPADRYPDLDRRLASLRSCGAISTATAAFRAALTTLTALSLILRPTAHQLTLVGVGDGRTTTLPAACTTTTPVTLDARLLLDALGAVSGTTTTLHVGGGLRPVHLHDDGLVHLLLPRQLPTVLNAATVA